MSSNLLHGQSLIGLYGGLGSSVFFDRSSTPHYTANYNSKNTYTFGLHYKERKNKLLNLALGLEYLHRNVDINASYGGRGFNIKRKFNLDIYSINLRILPEITIGNRVNFYFNAGPYAGLIVKAQKQGFGSSLGGLTGTSWTESGNALDEFNGLDLGISTSLGLSFPIFKKINFIFDINYGIGLNNISTGSIGSYAEKINSRNFHVTAGLVYKTSKFNISEQLQK